MAMKALDEYTSVTSVYNFYGHEVASALLSFHALTGSGITGKFSRKSKEFFTKTFLAERTHRNLIHVEP